MEEWKEIPGFGGYELSNLGNVRSYRKTGGGKHEIPKPIKDDKGYKGIWQKRVRLMKYGKQHSINIDKLVSELFG